MSSDVLVIGATGIFAPAAATLRASGRRVIGLSLRGSDEVVAVDARDAAALIGVLGGFRWRDALVYSPAVTGDSLKVLRAATPGRLVLVRTSAAVDPAAGDIVVPANTLQLGWTVGRPPRWHTPDEVSDAALSVLADGEARILGTIRPWSDRP